MTVRGVQRGGRFLVSSNMEFQLSPIVAEEHGAGQRASGDESELR